MTKKILSILLTLIMLASMLAMFAVGTTAEVSDLTTDVLEVDGTSMNLTEFLAADLSSVSTIKLLDDITLPANWTSIPTFAGTFDGNGKTINGLNISASGFIAEINGTTTIKNITFKNCTLTDDSNQYVGLVAAKATSGTVTFEQVTVENCTITGTKSNEQRIGGLLGAATNGVTQLTFTDCANIGGSISKAENKTAIIGGIVGSVDCKTEISDCKNSSAITAGYANNGGHKVAGIISLVNAGGLTMTDCINTGAITASALAGGMVSDVRVATTIDGCYNSGAITTGDAALTHTNNSYAGGIVAQFYNISNCTVKNSYNAGTVIAYAASGKNAFAGGIVSTSNKVVSVENAVNTGSVTSTNRAGGLLGKYTVTSGTLKNCLSLGAVSGKDDYSDGAFIGYFPTGNTDASVSITIQDCYFSANADDRALGTYTTLGSTNGNITAVYNGVTTTFTGGVDNVGEVPEGSSEYWLNYVLYNEMFEDKKLSNATGDATITCKGYQKNVFNTGDTTVDIRVVIGLAADDESALSAYQNIGYELYAVAENTAPVKATKTASSVYTELQTYNNDGTLSDPIKAATGEYLSAVAVNKIPATGTFMLVVKSFVTNADGSVTYGDGVVLMITDGIVVAHHLL